MAAYSGPEISNSGLVFNLDVPNAKNFELSSVQVLVVAGGGGGGANHAGGGGAGGLVYNSNFSVTPGTSYTVTVGAGGSKGTSYTTQAGFDGSNSVFGSLTAIGGGGGGNRRDGGTAGIEFGRPGGSGGGGGGQGTNDTPTSTGGAGTSGQGLSGGTASYHAGAGGGGAGTPGKTTLGSVGSSSSTTFPGDGGLGLPYDVSGTTNWYSGGGGGGGFIGGPYAGSGGTGGGGNGQINGSQTVNGTINTGGGGGGANGGGNANGGDGGSGIVIVRYRGPQRAIGGTVTKVGNDTVHTFTTSGTFLPLRRANNGEAVNSIVDMSSNIIGTCSSVTYNTANSGYLDFNGSSSELNFVPTPSGLTGTGSWTMCAWFKINGAPGNTAWQNVIIDTDPTGSSANMICADYGGIHGGTQHQLLYMSRPSTGGGYTTLTGPTLTVGTWYHAVVARNGTTDTKLYVNGALYNTFSGNFPTATQPLVRLGRWTDGTNYANVSIAAAQIYSRALSASEVNNLYQATRDRFGV